MLRLTIKSHHHCCSIEVTLQVSQFAISSETMVEQMLTCLPVLLLHSVSDDGINKYSVSIGVFL